MVKLYEVLVGEVQYEFTLRGKGVAMKEDASYTAKLRVGHAPSQPHTPMWGTDESPEKWGCLEARRISSVSTLQPPAFENLKFLNKSSTKSAPEMSSRTTRVVKSSAQIGSAWGYKYTPKGSIVMDYESSVGYESSEGDTAMGQAKSEENLEWRNGIHSLHALGTWDQARGENVVVGNKTTNRGNHTICTEGDVMYTMMRSTERGPCMKAAMRMY